MILLYDKCKEIGHLSSRCSCEVSKERYISASSSDVDRPTLVAIENEGPYEE